MAPKRKKASEPQEPTASVDHAGAMLFLSGFFAVVGAGCFVHMSNILVSIHQYSPRDIAFLGITLHKGGFTSEIVVQALNIMWLPISLLVIIAYHFQHLCRETGAARPHFPRAIGKLEIPASYPWMRTFLFVIFLIYPAGALVFCAGRAFDKYGIVDRNLISGSFENEEKNSASLKLAPALQPGKAASRFSLLTDFPYATDPTTNRFKAASWVWINLKRSDELRPEPGDVGKQNRIVTTQAIPIIQPWAFLVVPSSLFIFALILVFRGYFGTISAPKVRAKPPSTRRSVK